MHNSFTYHLRVQLRVTLKSEDAFNHTLEPPMIQQLNFHINEKVAGREKSTTRHAGPLARVCDVTPQPQMTVSIS